MVIFFAISGSLLRSFSRALLTLPSPSSRMLKTARMSSSLMVSFSRKNSASICLSRLTTPLRKISYSSSSCESDWNTVKMLWLASSRSEKEGSPSVSSFSFFIISATFIERMIVSFSRYSCVSSSADLSSLFSLLVLYGTSDSSPSSSCAD